MKTIVIRTTNNYPYYKTFIEPVFDKDAEKRYDELSKDLIQKVRNGELQNYELYMVNEEG